MFDHIKSSCSYISCQVCFIHTQQNQFVFIEEILLAHPHLDYQMTSTNFLNISFVYKASLHLWITYLDQWQLISCLRPHITLRPRQNERHFTDDIYRCTFLNENFRILNKTSLKYVPLAILTDNMAALVQIMIGAKPLSEPLFHRLLTHIWVTWPQWVKLTWMKVNASMDK